MFTRSKPVNAMTTQDREVERLEREIEARRLAEENRQRQEEADRRRGRGLPPAELRRRLAALEQEEAKVEELREAHEAAKLALANCEYLRLKKAAHAADQEARMAEMRLEQKRARLNMFLREAEAREKNGGIVQKVSDAVSGLWGADDDNED